MRYTFEEAKKLLVSYSRNQTEIIKQANSKRGVTKKSLKEEDKLIRELLCSLMQMPPTDQQVENLISEYS